MFRFSQQDLMYQTCSMASFLPFFSLWNKGNFYILLLLFIAFKCFLKIYYSLSHSLKSKMFKVLRLLLSDRRPAGTGHLTEAAMLKIPCRLKRKKNSKTLTFCLNYPGFHQSLHSYIQKPKTLRRAMITYNLKTTV